ncbi:MAG TPA: hypothetical protein VJT71_16285 [Pyrinomonadaceae bacterium]|nr:hypothetical protein [Pyrinomonadaceae bacterium]
MLKISPAVMVKEIKGALGTNDYTLFPDSEDKNVYYALAEFPTFLADGQGNPNFNLTWYFGSAVTSGGICTLTVALPIPDMSDPTVKSKIVDAVTGASTANIARKTLELCVAMKAQPPDKDKVAQLKKDLGLSDDEANKKAAEYKDGDSWEKFMPEGAKIKLRSIPFKAGTVTVQAFADQKNYKEGTPEFSTGKLNTTPSLVNSNAAVVTFNLQDQGANLFWHGLGGPPFSKGELPPAYDAVVGGKSVISVVYKVEFDGLLPSAVATVKLKQSVVAKVTTREVERRGAWGRRWKEEVISGKDYQDLVEDSTDIVLPSSASKEDQAAVQKLLSDWAAKQLEEMVKSQIPTVKLDDLSADTVRQLSTLKEQSRTYRLTQAITVPKFPQAQLPKVSGVVKPNTDLTKFFQLINLNDKPYFNVDLTVRPPSATYLSSLGVERFVVTKLTFGQQKLRKVGGQEVSNLEYVPSKPNESETLSGVFEKNAPNKSLDYTYLVAYNDGTPSFNSKLLSQTENANYLDLGGLDLGVLNVTLNTIDLPWDVLSGARVDLEYGSWKKSVALRRDESPRVVKPFGELMDKPLKYKLTLTPTAGAPVPGPETEVRLVRGAAEIQLKNPFGTSLFDINFALGSDVSKAQLKVDYSMPVSGGPARVFSKTVTLDRTTSTANWKVPKVDDGGTVQITKARITDSSNASKDLKDDPQSISSDSLDITVNTGGFDYF